MKVFSGITIVEQASLPVMVSRIPDPLRIQFSGLGNKASPLEKDQLGEDIGNVFVHDSCM